MDQRQCSECGAQKTLDDFYGCSKKGYGRRKCKACVRSRYQRRPKGPNRLGATKLDAILADLAQGMNLAEISRKHEVPYPTLHAWNRRGLLKKAD